MKGIIFCAVAGVLFSFAKTDNCFSQLSIENPFYEKPKSPPKEVFYAPKYKMKVAFVRGERFSAPHRFLRGLINLQEATRKFADIEISTSPNVILGSENIFNYPVLIFCPDNSFDISENEKHFLRDYISNGGFVIMDSYCPLDHAGRKGESSLRQMLIDTMGSKIKFVKIPNNHEIFHVISDFDDGPPLGAETPDTADDTDSRIALSMYWSFAGYQERNLVNNVVEEKYYIEGIYLGDRLVGVFSSKGYAVRWSNTTDNDPQLKMGVNMIVYAFEQPEGLLLKSIAEKTQ